MTKEEALKSLEEEIRQDTSLPLETNLVFGEGSSNCVVMFIGEAPGEQEDIQKRPFVGRGGQLLNKMLEAIGWKRESVYITNIVKRRPPNNRDPLPEEITAYKPYLSRQIAIIKPKIIATLGRFAMNYFAPDAKISRDHGKIFRVNGKFLLIPMYHPAAALRSADIVMSQFQRDFKKMKAVAAKADELLAKPTPENEIK
ncbi:MAG: uracil-DNA glycosylase [Patescibacteria group bacterium]